MLTLRTFTKTFSMVDTVNKRKIYKFIMETEIYDAVTIMHNLIDVPTRDIYEVLSKDFNIHR